MEKKYLLEICVDSVESAIAAERGGADRFELCSNLIIGGTTPGSCLFSRIREVCSLPIHVLIRPRFGDFCYTAEELEIIYQEIRQFRKLGADGVVIGALRPDGSLAMEEMRRMMEETDGMSVTLHRAFDVCRSPFETLHQAKKLGIDTVLTSGQAQTCLDGKTLLKELAEQAGEEINILAGSGVDASAIRILRSQTAIRQYHMSGKITEESAMQYRKEGVNMGLKGLSEYEIWRTSEEKVRAAVEILNNR